MRKVNRIVSGQITTTHCFNANIHWLEDYSIYCNTFERVATYHFE